MDFIKKSPGIIEFIPKMCPESLNVNETKPIKCCVVSFLAFGVMFLLAPLIALFVLVT